tara:strand:- start:33 stop:683 length:651 start_codon:yes stop_codon:yes gene_type:complete
MANLIIKSSADNLVLQGSDASPALTVAADGQTTFAENATLSGTANALGTVTSGNLEAAALVYPVGHCIQAVYANTHTQSSGNTDSWGGILSIAFTPIKADSRIVVTVAAGARAYVSAAWNEQAAWFRIEDVTNTSTLAITGMHHTWPSQTSNTSSLSGSIAMVASQLASVGSGAARTYTLQARTPSSTSYYWYCPTDDVYGTANCSAEMFIQEFIV